MWIIILGFAMATLLLGWTLFGYVVWLRFVGDSCKTRDVELPATYPTLSVIVPCLNERSQIRDKYRNLTDSTYPQDRMEIVFADGGSTDGTTEVLRDIAETHPQVRVVECPQRGKINQLNHVLPSTTGEVIVVTDADARLAPDALPWMAAEFTADPQTAVVGGYTSPRGGIMVERCYWAAQNRIRLLESQVGHVSLVVACCYGFRRSLFETFPNDVIADDTYVAAVANTAGFRTTYCGNALIEELRTPVTLPEFFRHKFRKSNAVLREYLRFAYRLPDIDSCWKSILSTRLIQQLLLPWATAIWIMSAAVLANLGQIDIPLLGGGALIAAMFATRKATMSIELPDGPDRSNLTTVVLAYCYTMTILFATALSYPYFRQSSCYDRLNHAPDTPAPTAKPTLNRASSIKELETADLAVGGA